MSRTIWLIAGIVCWYLLMPSSQRVSAQFVSSVWPKNTGAPVNSSPVLGDLDGDGVLEVVVGADNNKVYAWKPDGTLMPGWPVTTGDSVRSSPALADIDGDGRLDVIVGSFDNKVYAWNFHGSLLPGWPAVTGSVVYSSPAVGDIDGDQLPEIVVGSFDNKVYAWNADGTLVREWPKPTGLFVYSSPALADIDRDGLPEIIVGTDNNRVFAWNGDGTEVEGWPTATEHVVPSSPAVGDIDNDGVLEVIVASWDKVFVWNSQGERKTGWPVTAGHQIPSSPALADLNNDGRLEIIIGCKDGRVYVWEANGQLFPGWPAVTDAEISASPAVADLDGDGRLEIIIGSKDHKVYIWDVDGRLFPGWPKATDGPISSSPAVGDLDRDGTLEVVIGSKDQNVYVWSFPRTGSLPPRVVWRNFHSDPSHSGMYGIQPTMMTATAPREIPVRPGTPAQLPTITPITPGQQPRELAVGEPLKPVIQQPVVPREILEGYISDLVISDYEGHAVTLTWTTPPGAYSPQAVYDIRYAPQPITEDTWDAASAYPARISPATPGSREVQQLTNLVTAENRPVDMLYLAVRIVDGNRQYPLSNVVRFERQDTEPPARVTSLTVTELNDDLLELSWIASGDDGNSGAAATYDIRYSEAPLNEVTWMRATQIDNEPAPLPAGTEQRVQVSKPWSDREIFWGMKVIDESLNISDLSEIAVWSPRDDIPPSRIVNLRVTNLAGTTVTLTWTAPGNNLNIGKAARYEIRYSQFPIMNEAEWMAATLAPNPPEPAESGTQQSYQLQGVPIGELLFVGIKAFDRSGNASALSNVVETAMDDLTPPAPVTDLKIEQVGKDWASLSWTASGDDGQQGVASAYILRYGGNFRVVTSWTDAIDVQDVPIPSAAGTNETATIRGLQENTTYYVGVQVLDDQGNSSDISNILRVKTLGHSTPATVTDLVVEELRADGMTLNWTAPEDFGEETSRVSGYDIRYARDEITEDTWESAAKFNNIPTPSAPEVLETVTLTGGPRDSAYYVALKSYDALGNMSALSNVVHIPQIDTVPPAPILDLFVEDTGQDWIRLSWTATGDDQQQGQASAVQIRLAPSLNRLKEWDQATNISNTLQPAPSGMKETFTMTGLSPDSTFFVAVKSVDEFGNTSEMSNIVRANTKDAVPPAAMTDLQVVGVDNGDVVLEWTAPGENGMQGQAKAYDIRYAQELVTPQNWDVIQVVSVVPRPAPAGSRESLTVSENLLPNTTYYFGIVAVDASGNESPISNVVRVVTGDTIAPDPITTLIAEHVDETSALLRWFSPGDDQLHATPAQYEIRYARQPLSEATWAQATPTAESPIPSPQGEEEQFLLADLQPDASYYVGIKAIDADGNVSDLSNVIRIYTMLEAVTDLQILEFSGQSVTLTWTAPGGMLSGGQRVYAIRYATARITEETWNEAVPANVVAEEILLVSEPGQTEKIELLDLPMYEQVFFAVRVEHQQPAPGRIDPLVSALSNVVELNRLDLLAPAEVTDLDVTDLGDIASGIRSLALTWQAPGDNGMDGAATKYEIRYGTLPPTEETWNSFTLAPDVPTPQEAGTMQRVNVQVPYQEDNIYFALRTFDEALNVSGISNIAQWSPEDFTPPAAVLDLTAQRLSNGDIKVAWTAPGDNADRGIAAFYDIRYATKASDLEKWDRASTVPGEPLPEPAGARQEHLITNLDSDESYYVAMKTVDDAKNISDLSNIVAVSKVLPPAIDDLAFLDNTDTTVTLTWTLPRERATRLVKYDIRYAEELGRLEQWSRAERVAHDLEPRSPGTSDSIVIEKLTPKTHYYFAVRTIDASGETSELSNIVEVTTEDLILPEPIDDLAYVGGTDTSVTLSWTAPDDRRSGGRVVRYDIRYAEDLDTLERWDRAHRVRQNLVPNAPGTTDSITIEHLSPNRRYYFAIKSVDHRGEESVRSNMAAAYTTDTIPPQPVIDLAVAGATKDAVTLTWTVQADDATHDRPDLYDLRYSLEPITDANWETAVVAETFDQSLKATEPGNLMQYTVDGLQENTRYHFAIRAIDMQGNMSALSNPAVARTDDVTAPQAVADLQAMFPTPSSVMLVWTCPADAVSTGAEPATGSPARGVGEASPLVETSLTEDALLGAYDIRYVELPLDGTPLNEASWDMAHKALAPPAPLTPGTMQEFVVRNLEPDTTYAFAIKAIDPSGNVSAISNIVMETTLPQELVSTSQSRSISPTDASGWELVQGELFAELRQDELGALTLATTSAARALTAPPAITAVYPRGNQSLALRQGELVLNVKSDRDFLICAKVQAAVDGDAPYTLCYTPSEYLMNQAQTVEGEFPTRRPHKRIEHYVFYAIDPAIADDEWHELRLNLAQDLLAGTGLLYQEAERVAVRGAQVTFRGISLQGEVLTPIDDFEQGMHPLESGWKLHFGTGVIQVTQDAMTPTSLQDPGVTMAQQPNTYLYAKSETDQPLVLTYPRDGSARLSDKPIFLASVKAGMDFKLILKVSTKDQREYYLAYVPEAEFHNMTSSGNYIYVPLAVTGNSQQGDWLRLSAHIAEDLRRNQLEYDHTSWISFHGKEFSLDNVGFSTERLETHLK